MTRVAWGVFLVLTFLVTLSISWWSLAKIDFAYGFLYHTMDIPAHIDEFSSENTRNKKNFELTTKAEHKALFHNIISAIQTDGTGLQELSYIDRKRQQETVFLTKEEVVHLQDVADLLNKLSYVVLFLWVLWASILLKLWQLKIVLPSTKQLLISTAIILLALGTLLFLLSPEAIFSQFHVWVFPDNHQWFFYYEESLMTVLMKAPDIFAYIALIWFLFSLALTFLFLLFIRRLLAHKY